jgi:mono/diheme cytochrome c family protein
MLRTQIVLGILMMIATVGTMAYIGATEDTRMATATESQLARRIENGAYIYHNNCETCHGEFAEGIPGLCPPLNNSALLTDRMRETGWSGSLHNWLVDTIRGGRLTSTRPEQYVGRVPEGSMAMPFWSQDFGGPLRNDQIEDLAYYLENMPDEPYDSAGGPTPTPIAIDTSDPDAVIAAGVEVYQANGCIGCHALSVAGAAGAVGPTHEGMGATAEERIADPNYTGEATTAEEYIRESILNPNVYTVDGYASGLMPSYSTLPEDQIEAMVQMLLLQQ